MATRIQFRRGTTSDHSTFTGAVGEVTVDTTKDTLVVHDGSQVAGYPLGRADASNMSNPQFSGTSALVPPKGTTAQRPSLSADTTGWGTIRYNNDTHTIESWAYNPINASTQWIEMGVGITNLYKRGVTEGTYTATLNENIFNFHSIVTRSANWRNLYIYNVDTLASPNTGTTNASGYGQSMIDTYYNFHSYIQINTSGNQLVLGAGNGYTAYEIWGIR